MSQLMLPDPQQHRSYTDYRNDVLDRIKGMDNYDNLIIDVLSDVDTFVSASPTMQHLKLNKNFKESPAFRAVYYMSLFKGINALSIDEWEQKRGRQEQPKKVDLTKLKTTAGFAREHFDNSFQNYSLDNEKKKSTVDDLKKLVADWKGFRKSGLNLIFQGKTGTGKTHLAHAMLVNMIWYTEKVCYYRKWNSLIAQFRQNSRKELDILQPLIECPLLVLDEIGGEGATDYSMQKLHHLIDERSSCKCYPTILITNMTDKDLDDYSEKDNGRLKSRLFGNKSVGFSFHWDDYRKKDG